MKKKISEILVRFVIRHMDSVELANLVKDEYQRNSERNNQIIREFLADRGLFDSFMNPPSSLGNAWLALIPREWWIVENNKEEVEDGNADILSSG